jgi:hypothetical protein
MDTSEVLHIASQVRGAIEALPASKRPITFSHFPRGACGDCCLILGTYFEEECGFPPFHYVSAERGSKSDNTWSSHAWLECGDLIVDITADQFPDAPSGVIVSRSSAWHDGFEVDHRSKSNLKHWSGQGTCHVLHLYSYVKRVLSSGVFESSERRDA